MVAPSFSTGNPILDFIYILLNGISEVPLISSPLTGLLILTGVFIASRKAGIMMAVSGLIGAAVALMMGASYNLVTFGLFGFNSILTGMAFYSGPFTKSNKATLTMSLVGAGVTAVIWMAFAHIMGDLFVLGGNGWAIPGFTSSFIFTTWIMMYASKRYGHDIWPSTSTDVSPHTISQLNIFSLASGVRNKDDLIENSENPKQVIIPGFKWTPWEFVKAVLNGVSQVTFVENWKTGLMWVIGLTLSFELVGNRIFTNAFTTGWNPYSMLYLGGAMALVGSAIGVSLAILAKLPVTETKAGIHGFNQVLVMIAITSFLPFTWQSFLYAVLATAVCSLFTMPAMQNFFGRWGLPALTGPFVFTTWFFLLAAPYLLNIPFGIGWGRP